MESPVGRQFGGARTRLVEELRAKGIRDLAVLRAFDLTPRHLFVPTGVQHRAYDDAALPIGNGQTISQPSVHARYLEVLGFKGTERVLEIGTGSGYQTVLLSHLAAQVFSVERIAPLLDRARQAIKDCDVSNVSLMLGDGTYGWSAYAPYDAILVSAASPDVPAPLLAQLADGGRMMVPVGGRDAAQRLRCSSCAMRRSLQGGAAKSTMPCSFVLAGPETTDGRPGVHRHARSEISRRILRFGTRAGRGAIGWFAREAGRACGVACTALNLDDGTVQVDATGSDDAMITFLTRLREGPSHAHVTGVVITERGGASVADDVRRAIRDVADFPKVGIVRFKDITPVLLDAALFRRATNAIAEPFAGDGISHVVAIESRGFILGAPVAQALGAAFVPTRKPGKLPAATMREEYALEYGTDALEMHADALVGATGVLVVDDVPRDGRDRGGVLSIGWSRARAVRCGRVRF